MLTEITADFIQTVGVPSAFAIATLGILAVTLKRAESSRKGISIAHAKERKAREEAHAKERQVLEEAHAQERKDWRDFAEQSNGKMLDMQAETITSNKELIASFKTIESYMIRQNQ